MGVIFVAAVPVMPVRAMWHPQMHDGRGFLLVQLPVHLLLVRLLGMSVHADGDVLRVDQGAFRWTVPTSATTGVSATNTGGCLVLRTGRREITTFAFTHSLGADLAGNRSLLRAAEGIQRWAAVRSTHDPGDDEPRCERASGWLVLRDDVVLLVGGQLLWVVVAALRPAG